MPYPVYSAKEEEDIISKFRHIANEFNFEMEIKKENVCRNIEINFKKDMQEFSFFPMYGHDKNKWEGRAYFPVKITRYRKNPIEISFSVSKDTEKLKNDLMKRLLFNPEYLSTLAKEIEDSKVEKERFEKFKEYIERISIVINPEKKVEIDPCQEVVFFEYFNEKYAKIITRPCSMEADLTLHNISENKLKRIVEILKEKE